MKSAKDLYNTYLNHAVQNISSQQETLCFNKMFRQNNMYLRVVDV